MSLILYQHVQAVNIRAVQCSEYQKQVKQNLNRYLTFTVNQDMKTYGGNEALLRALQIWACSDPGIFNPKENNPASIPTENWVGITAGVVDPMKK